MTCKKLSSQLNEVTISILLVLFSYSNLIFLRTWRLVVILILALSCFHITLCSLILSYVYFLTRVLFLTTDFNFKIINTSTIYRNCHHIIRYVLLYIIIRGFALSCRMIFHVIRLLFLWLNLFILDKMIVISGKEKFCCCYCDDVIELLLNYYIIAWVIFMFVLPGDG